MNTLLSILRISDWRNCSFTPKTERPKKFAMELCKNWYSEVQFFNRAPKSGRTPNTACTRRVESPRFQAGCWLEAGSGKAALSRPAHPRVRKPLGATISKDKWVKMGNSRKKHRFRGKPSGSDNYYLWCLCLNSYDK